MEERGLKKNQLVEVGTFFEEVLIKDRIELLEKSKTGYDFRAGKKFLTALQQEKRFFLFLEDRILKANAIVIEVEREYLSSDLPKLGYDPRLKRRFPRATISCFEEVNAVVFSAKTRAKLGSFLVRDVSETGVSLIVEKGKLHLLSIGKEVLTSFPLKGKEIRVKAVVVNQEEVEEGYFKVGMFFTDISIKNRDIIASFVMKRHREIIRNFY